MWCWNNNRYKIGLEIDLIMCSRKNFACIKTILTTIAIFNFSLHLTNIVMHIYYYSLVTNSGIVLSMIGIVFVLYSMYNYLIVNLNQQKLYRKIYVWKIFCWIKKLHQKFLLKYILPFTQVGFWYRFLRKILKLL